MVTVGGDVADCLQLLTLRKTFYNTTPAPLSQSAAKCRTRAQRRGRQNGQPRNYTTTQPVPELALDVRRRPGPGYGAARLTINGC